jgi:hypothetical protein
VNSSRKTRPKGLRMKGKQSPGALAAGALATRNFIRGSLLNNKSVKVLFYFSLEILRMKIYYTKVTGWRHWRLKTSSSTPVSKALVSKGPVPKGPESLDTGAKALFSIKRPCS